jgi:hypothetical protein
MGILILSDPKRGKALPRNLRSAASLGFPTCAFHIAGSAQYGAKDLIQVRRSRVRKDQSHICKNWVCEPSITAMRTTENRSPARVRGIIHYQIVTQSQSIPGEAACGGFATALVSTRLREAPRISYRTTCVDPMDGIAVITCCEVCAENCLSEMAAPRQFLFTRAA